MRIYIRAALGMIILGLFIGQTAKSQIVFGSGESDKITGMVEDQNRVSIPYATVLLVNPADSTVVQHTQSGEQGWFQIEKYGATNKWLQVHALGYYTETMTLTAPLKPVYVFKMREDPKEIAAVRIEARRRGMKIVGDTVKYNIKAYLTGNERSLGDLLAQLPGLKVSESGRVTAQGKPVEKILFNGRDLFGTNVTMATQHVSADVADSVSVIHGYSEYDLRKGFESSDKTVIDVAVKPSMWNKLTGEVEVGYGYKHVYTGRAMAMYIGQKHMFAGVAATNRNTGNPSFSGADFLGLQGGMDNMQNLPSNTLLWQLASPPRDSYRLRTAFGSLYYTYNKPDTVKVNAGLLVAEGKVGTRSSTDYHVLHGLDSGQTLSTQDSRLSYYRGVFGMLGISYTPNRYQLWRYAIASTLSQEHDDHLAGDLLVSRVLQSAELTTNSPFYLQQDLMGNIKLGKHLLEAKFTHSYLKEKPSYGLKSDSLILPLVAPMAGGLHRVDHLSTTQDHQLKGALSTKFRLVENQFLEVGLRSSTALRRFTSEFSSPDGVIADRTIPNIGRLTSSNDADLLRTTTTLLLAWRKTKGFVRFSLEGDANLLAYRYSQIVHTEPLNAQPYLTFGGSLDFNFTQQNRLSLSAGLRRQETQLDWVLEGYVPMSYRVLRYRDFSRSFTHITLEPYASVGGRLSDEEGTWSLYGSVDYSRDEDFSQSGLRWGLLTLYAPYATTHGHRGRASLRGNYQVGAFWNLSGWASLSARKGEAVYGGAFSQHRQGGVDLSASVRSSYSTPFNVGISGQWARTGFGIAESPLWFSESWNCEARLIYKRNPIRATLTFGYEQPESLLNARADWVADAEFTYTFWKGMSVILVGRRLLNLDESQWREVDFGTLYQTERVYSRIPGYVMVKLRWEFGKPSSERRAVVIMR